MKRPDATRLIDIIEAADHISGFLSVETSIHDFVNDEMLQSAVLYQIMVIGEAVANISENLKSKYVEVDWADIKTFRNVIVHEYFAKIIKTIWDTVKDDVPNLRIQAERIFKTEFPDLIEYLPKRD